MAAGVLAPMVAQGVIVRRRRLVRVAARVDADGRAVRLLRALRGRYGPGPLRISLPGREIALVLDSDDVRRVLADDADFLPATRDKRAALATFQPHGVLVTRGELRESRRRFVEAALDSGRPHRLVGRFEQVVEEEMGVLLAETAGRLDWDAFNRSWWRVVRRIVLGDRARTDDAVTDELTALRRAGNWAGLARSRYGVKRRFADRVAGYARRAEPGSLAAVVAATPAGTGVDPAGQIPHWLFAFDAAGIAAFRTLALLAARPGQAHRASDDPGFLQACVLESVRLWPTTMAILRETARDTRWRGATLPAGAELVVVSALFHRDTDTVPYADEFAPDEWLSGRAAELPAIVPFSAGPGRCPGREVVLAVTGMAAAALLRRGEPRPVGATRRLADRRLPGTVDHFALRVLVPPALPNG